ncbi:MAG: hypothetical protein WCF12_09755 [Propionicimonas sp.]
MTTSGSLPPHDRPLFGPEGTIPQVNAVAVTRTSGWVALRGRWGMTQTVVLLAAMPLLFVVYRAAAGPSAGAVGMVAHAVAALLASVIVASYLPFRRGERLETSACGVMPALMVVLAAIALNSSVFPGGEAAALAVLGFGLWQRLSGFSTCGVTSTKR